MRNRAVRSLLRYAVGSTIGAVILSGTAAAQAGETRTAVADCRAGCQGNPRGCQQATQFARFDARPGYYIDVSSLRITNSWPASNSPGLAQIPEWSIGTSPSGASRARDVFISARTSSCVGRSADTQGVTFFQWSATYYPGQPSEPAPSSGGGSGGSGGGSRVTGQPTLRVEEPGSAILLHFSNSSGANFRCSGSYSYAYSSFGSTQTGSNSYAVDVPNGTSDAVLSRFSGSYPNLRTTSRVSMQCNRT